MAWLHWFLFKLVYLYLHYLSTVIFTGSSSRKVNSHAFFVHSAYTFFLLFEMSSVYTTALQGFFLSLALVDGDI